MLKYFHLEFVFQHQENTPDSPPVIQGEWQYTDQAVPALQVVYRCDALEPGDVAKESSDCRDQVSAAAQR
jgi:hypothetical protein